MGGFIGLGLGLLALYGAHHWLSVREISAPPKMIMDAEVYPAGEGWVIRRQVQDPLASVVVMPGFLESPQYFLRYYDDPRIELIMVSNSGEAQGHREDQSQDESKNLLHKGSLL